MTRPQLSPHRRRQRCPGLPARSIRVLRVLTAGRRQCRDPSGHRKGRSDMEREQALDAVLGAARGLYETARNDHAALDAALAVVLQEISASPAALRDQAPARKPACRHWEGGLALAEAGPPMTALLSRALRTLEPHLPWLQNPNYTAEAVGAHFVDNYAYFDIMGPRGLIESERAAMGLLLMGHTACTTRIMPTKPKKSMSSRRRAASGRRTAAIGKPRPRAASSTIHPGHRTRLRRAMNRCWPFTAGSARSSVTPSLWARRASAVSPVCRTRGRRFRRRRRRGTR